MFFERLLNILGLVSCKFLSSFSRWFQSLNNHFKSKLKPLISSQKLSIKRKRFLQCSCKSKPWHLLSIYFTLFRYSSVNSLERFPMQNLFYDTKPFGSSPNDLQISRNTIWKNDLYINSDFLNKFLLYFLHSSFSIIECNLYMRL